MRKISVSNKKNRIVSLYLSISWLHDHKLMTLSSTKSLEWKFSAIKLNGIPIYQANPKINVFFYK